VSRYENILFLGTNALGNKIFLYPLTTYIGGRFVYFSHEREKRNCDKLSQFILKILGKNLVIYILRNGTLRIFQRISLDCNGYVRYYEPMKLLYGKVAHSMTLGEKCKCCCTSTKYEVMYCGMRFITNATLCIDRCMGIALVVKR
jgi:hypothetical protein